MPNKLRNIVVWLTLAQVVLVGALGTGLHSLLGCEHGPHGCCGQGCDVAACGSLSASDVSDCQDCAFCQRRRESQGNAGSVEPSPRLATADDCSCCDGCAVCSLLGQYNTAYPFTLDALSIDLVADDATVLSRDAVFSAATRLALSRGPPAA